MKRKNVITLCVLSAVLAGCLVLYFFLPAGKQGDGDKDTSGKDSIAVDTIAEASISQIVFQKGGKEIWSVKKTKDQWKFTEDGSIPVNKKRMETITKALQPVTATEKLGNAEDGGKAYGLDMPSMVLTVTAKDGREYRYEIGMEVPKAEMGYYARSNAGDEVFCLSGDFVRAVDASHIQMIQMDELPEIETDYMTYISVENEKGNDFEAKYVSEREKVDFYSHWNITKPYKKPLATSATEWNSTLGFFNVLQYTELVDYRTKKKKEYGLQKPSSVITIRYYEAKKGYTPTATATPSVVVTGDSSGKSAYIIPKNKREYKTLSLCIGKKTKSGYYVCEKGKEQIYKMDADVVERMTKLDAYTSMDHCIYSVLATSIKGFDVTYGGKTLRVRRTTVKKDGEKETATAKPTSSAKEGTAVENTADKNRKNIWWLNGKKISDKDENDFLTPYSTAYLLEYSGKAERAKAKKSDKPVLTIVYHEEHRDVTVKYLPYDGVNFYQVDKNGMDYFLVDKLLVDDVIGKFKEIERLG